MTIDISKVKVGDIVTARFEDEVDYVVLEGTYRYVSTKSGAEFTETVDEYFTDVKFTTPKPPLPTTLGSLASVSGIYYMLCREGWISTGGRIFQVLDFTGANYVIKYDAGADNG